MLRIISSLSPAIVTLHLQGKLLAPWVEEVQANVAAASTQGAVRLDLSELQFADESGLRLLQALQRQQVELAGASALIAALMERAASSSST